MDAAEELIVTRLGGSRIDKETPESVTVYTCGTHTSTNALALMKRASTRSVTITTTTVRGCYARDCQRRSRFALTADKIQTAFTPPF